MIQLTQTDGSPTAGYVVRDKRIDFAYNKAGQFTSIKRYEDLSATELVVTSTYGYDSAGRLTSLLHDLAGTTSDLEYAWTYDSANRLTEVTSPDGTSTFTYDATHQLTAADHDYQTDEEYEYDDNGNRTMTGYSTGTNNRLLSDGTYDYQYDDEGNRTKKTEIATGDYVLYLWDHRSQHRPVVRRDRLFDTSIPPPPRPGGRRLRR